MTDDQIYNYLITFQGKLEGLISSNSSLKEYVKEEISELKAALNKREKRQDEIEQSIVWLKLKAYGGATAFGGIGGIGAYFASTLFIPLLLDFIKSLLKI